MIPMVLEDANLTQTFGSIFLWRFQADRKMFGIQASLAGLLDIISAGNEDHPGKANCP